MEIRSGSRARDFARPDQGQYWPRISGCPARRALCHAGAAKRRRSAKRCRLLWLPRGGSLGVLVDSEGLTAFNSHWLIQDRWFALPTVVWEQIDQQQSVLRAFSPENMADGEPDRLALGRYPNPTLLQPVDDELVDRLDAWRDEALKSALSHSGVDEHLQILFAKLFVLRTIEDRGLAPQVTPLSAATDGPTTLQVRNLLKTFREAR